MRGYPFDQDLAWMIETSSQITQQLATWNAGDRDALAQLMPLVSEQLREIAARTLRGERPNHTLQPTALVNELYLRLHGHEVDWKNRQHFFGFSAIAMRHILVDHARAREADRRGGKDLRLISLEQASDLIDPRNPADLSLLGDALDALSQVDARQARIVDLRFFVGLNVEETASALEISRSSVKREWKLAKIWLCRELAGRRH